jgi:uncharacterized membrane protein YraQ (UPF0718 family)
METLGAKLLAGVTTTLGFVWDSLYGLILGFLISAIAQNVGSRGAIERALGPNLRGIANGAGFGIIASACSYGAATAARAFFLKGADVRAVFAFLISSTNMNLAILIMFWAMLGWRFAFAEFAGGIVIIAVVASGFTVLFKPGQLSLPASAVTGAGGATATLVESCLQCGMDGDEKRAVEYEGTSYLFCSAGHEAGFRADPAGTIAAARGEDEKMRGLAALRERATWRDVLDTLRADLAMLRNELIVGFSVAGFAAAFVPPVWISGTLHAVGGVPFVGYPLLLLAGLAIAVVTFVCSMGNVPIARFLALAGTPLGANTTFIYGDLLIPPLVGIYRKSFPPRIVWTFLVLFIAGAMLAGALMDALFGGLPGAAMQMGAMAFSDRFTLVANVLALAALAAAIVAARGAAATHDSHPAHASSHV